MGESPGSNDKHGGLVVSLPVSAPANSWLLVALIVGRAMPSFQRHSACLKVPRRRAISDQDSALLCTTGHMGNS